MQQYEAPIIKFEKLAIFEKIACNTCWDHKHFHFNNPLYDGDEDLDIIINANNPNMHCMPGGCDARGNWVRATMMYYMQAWTWPCNYQWPNNNTMHSDLDNIS